MLMLMLAAIMSCSLILVLHCTVLGTCSYRHYLAIAHGNKIKQNIWLLKGLGHAVLGDFV